ncbi:hypothetical protein CRG98_001854 [Punica granatum]|uniref:Uncharacterized protein n=1 Tax=Punica granatum TaxID=22663 RepID=A0A2I0LAN8_PUNGR|nr:hypothetical protein CRG98_001854 [Punica granatum]
MATSGRTSTREIPMYVVCRGCIGTSFNRECPSVRRLLRLCWRKLQPGMPQCMSLGEIVLARASTEDALVYVAWKCSSRVDGVRGGLGANVGCECLGQDCRCDSWARPMGCRVRMTFVYGNLVITILITTLEWLDRDRGPHKHVFPGCE